VGHLLRLPRQPLDVTVRAVQRLRTAIHPAFRGRVPGVQLKRAGWGPPL
jgi:hypothetical protein